MLENSNAPQIFNFFLKKFGKTDFTAAYHFNLEKKLILKAKSEKYEIKFTSICLFPSRHLLVQNQQWKHQKNV